MGHVISLTRTVDERAAAAGLSLARLARDADVSYRRIWENRLDREESNRVERVLTAHENSVVEDGR